MKEKEVPRHIDYIPPVLPEPPAPIPDRDPSREMQSETEQYQGLDRSIM